MLKKNDVEPQAYRDAMARFAGAVHVVTTDGAAGRRGTTVIAACSVSDAPPTVLVCLNRENAEERGLRRERQFRAEHAGRDQQALAVAFSGLTGLSTEERFALGDWDTIATGAPTLVGALAVFDCEIIDTKDHATHRVLFGKVTGLRIGDSFNPLLYFNRSYRVSVSRGRHVTETA